MSLEITYVHGQKLVPDSDCYDVYLKYKSDTISNASDPNKLASILNDYLNYAKDYEINNPNSASVRSAYYSSILEEHPVLVFGDHVTNLTSNLTYDFSFGNKECVIFSGANTKCNPRYESKKIDFALCVSNKDYPYPVLLVGFEVKKYLDKTMYDSVVHTHELLRTFRPSTVYAFMGEDEARGKDVIANSMMSGKEFILTGKERNKGLRHQIDSSIYTKWYDFTKKSIEETILLLK
jgi:hypothetical protein